MYFLLRKNRYSSMGIRCSTLRSKHPAAPEADGPPVRLYSSTVCVNMEHRDPSALVDISLEPLQNVTILYRMRFPDISSGIRVDISAGKRHVLDCTDMSWQDVTKIVRGFRNWLKNQKIQIQITDTRQSRRHPKILVVNFSDLNMKRSIILWAETITGLHGASSNVCQVPVVLRENVENQRDTGLFDVAACGEDNSWTYARKVDIKEICTYELGAIVTGTIDIQVMTNSRRRRRRRRRRKKRKQQPIVKEHTISEQPGLEPVLVTPRKKKKKEKTMRPRSLSARGPPYQRRGHSPLARFTYRNPESLSPGRRKLSPRPASIQLPARRTSPRPKTVSWSTSESDPAVMTEAGRKKVREQEEDGEGSSSMSSTGSSTPTSSDGDAAPPLPPPPRRRKRKKTKKKKPKRTSPVPPLKLNEVVVPQNES